MPEGIDLGLSGLASGFDWRTLVDQLTDVDRAPQRRLLVEQNTLDQRKNAYGSIATQLGVLRNRIAALKEATSFDARSVGVSDATAASAVSSETTPVGNYAFAISQLATASVQPGSVNTGRALNATNDVSQLTLGDAASATPIRAGTITVNGRQVTLATTDTLQEAFEKIRTATSGDVTASYDATTDTISLAKASPGEITLGSAADTSNFLTASKLGNNGTGSVTSSSALGAIKTSGPLTGANFATAINDGGAGLFRINGVDITFDADADSVSDLVSRINNSSAGVTATYDSVSDRFSLTNKVTGDLGVALEDVSGNFLAATGLGAGTLQRGKDLLYTMNGGGQLSSHSNTISQESAGVAGLSVAALKEGASVTVKVSADTDKIKTAITDFITEYNKAQSLIDSNTASTTDAKGKVTAGTLAAESDASNMASGLRRLVTAQLSGLSGTLKQLASLGISSNGKDNTLAVADDDALDAALETNLSGVKDLFTNSTTGLAVQLDNYLEKAIGEEGSIVAKQDNLTDQSTDIDTQISDQERLVQSHRSQLITSFLAMETAQQRMNQQVAYLNQRFGGS